MNTLKHLLITLFTIAFITSSLFAQFEKAYFIDADNIKIECYIDNKEWKNSPKKFNYKLKESDSVQTKNTLDIKEFGSDDYKYIVREVLIDRWKDKLENITEDGNANFEKEVCVLKQLVQGKLNLYLYENELIKKYFIQDGQNNIEQLIYKKFYKVISINGIENTTDRILINDTYKKQLEKYNHDACVNKTDFKKLDLNVNALVQMVLRINECFGQVSKNYLKKRTLRESVNFYIKAGTSRSQISINYRSTDQIWNQFDTETEPRFGFEFEYILPYRNKKWSVLNKTIYSKYLTEKDVGLAGLESFYYNSINIHFGLKRYFDLTKKYKFFITGYTNYQFESSNLYAVNYPIKVYLPINQGFSTAGSLGFLLFNRFEINYQYSKRNLSNGSSWKVKYNYHSLNLGVNLI